MSCILSDSQNSSFSPCLLLEFWHLPPRTLNIATHSRYHDIKIMNSDWQRGGKSVLPKGQSDFLAGRLFPRQPYSQWDTFLLRGSAGKLRLAIYIESDIHHALIRCLIRFPDSCGILKPSSQLHPILLSFSLFKKFYTVSSWKLSVISIVIREFSPSIDRETLTIKTPKSKILQFKFKWT